MPYHGAQGAVLVLPLRLALSHYLHPRFPSPAPAGCPYRSPLPHRVLYRCLRPPRFVAQQRYLALVLLPPPAALAWAPEPPLFAEAGLPAPPSAGEAAPPLGSGGG